MVYDIVEGTTDKLKFQLLDNGSPINLTNYTVSLNALNREGNSVTTAVGSVSVIDATNGIVQLTPIGINSFVAASGPYFFRWQLLHNTLFTQSFVPSSTSDVINIFG